MVNRGCAKTAELSTWLGSQPETTVFEPDSTDYQLPPACNYLVRDGFAILKVGPGVTFVMREALEDRQSQLISERQRSWPSEVLEHAMFHAPESWLLYSVGTAKQQKLLSRYSYSDRVRYYWGCPEVVADLAHLAKKSLLGENLHVEPLPAS